MTLQPIAGQSQKLRSGREIPIGMGRVCVPEIGRQQREAATRIDIVVSVSVENGVDGKSVPKVVEPRSTYR
jgi:hypothetical protein